MSASARDDQWRASIKKMCISLNPGLDEKTVKITEYPDSDMATVEYCGSGGNEKRFRITKNARTDTPLRVEYDVEPGVFENLKRELANG